MSSLQVIAKTAKKIQAKLHPKQLPKPKRSKFIAALLCSCIFHLSMITVFRIVIAFPKDTVQYYELHIIASTDTMEISSPASQPLRSRNALTLTGQQAMPEVHLPIIEFAEMERLRIRYTSPDMSPSDSDEYQTIRIRDSWARFGEELQRLGKSLREIALPSSEIEKDLPEPPQRVVQSFKPAEGFEATIEWNNPPTTRELLFAPPLRALWNLNPAELTRPLEIVLKVDANGKVVNVWSPQLDDSGLIEEVQMTILQYRFAPLSEFEQRTGTDFSTTEQTGIVIIRRAGTTP